MSTYPEIQTNIIGEPDSPNDIRLRGVKTYNFDTPLSPQSQLRKRASAFQRKHKYIFGVLIVTTIVIVLVSFIRMIPERGTMESLPSWKKRPADGADLKRRTIELRQLQQLQQQQQQQQQQQINKVVNNSDSGSAVDGDSGGGDGNVVVGSEIRELGPNEIEDDGTVCLNTVQGKDLLTDSRGIVCNRRHVNDRGCCSLAIDRLSCRTCRRDLQCCHSFEYCVSCCLAQPPPNSAAYASDHRVGTHGGWQAPVETESKPAEQGDGSGSGQLLRGGNIMGGVELGVGRPVDPEHFDHCLHMCRTSSRSIKHGNQYRNPLRHCYADNTQTPPSELAAIAAVAGQWASTMIVSSKMGESCTSACSRVEKPSSGVLADLRQNTGVGGSGGGGAAMMCHEDFLSQVNTCTMLEKEFLCEAGCGDSAGVDQPAYVDPSAAESFSPGRCLVNKDTAQFDCDGSHPFTRRLCVCIQTHVDEQQSAAVDKPG